MTDAVIHIPSSTHEPFKAACLAKKVRMRDIANRLILTWIADTGIKKAQAKPQPKTNTVDPYTAPPFWAERDGG